MPRPLPDRKILITNWHLDTRTGTDIVTRDLAFSLRDAGCDVVIYCQRPGGMSADIQSGGVRVVTCLEDVGFVPDVIHGHHHVITMTALLHFPHTPALFVCHNAIDGLDHPPFHPNLRMYVAVDFNCRERLVKEAHVAEADVRVVGNAVDLKRFQPRHPLPAKPSRAALFSNYAKDGDAWVEAVMEGCRAEGIVCEVIGSGMGNSCERPETIIGQYDVVFGVARCAMEAAATGCAVILCGEKGFGMMLTPQNIDHHLDWNCGFRLLKRQATVENVRNELRQYHPDHVQAVSLKVRNLRGLGHARDLYRGLYEELIQPDEHILAMGKSWDVRLQKNLFERQETDVRLRRAENAASLGQPEMERLGPSNLSQIRIKVEDQDKPRSIPPGKSLKLQVTLQNKSKIALSSGGFLPVALSYHWRDARTGDNVLFENSRTYLDEFIGPGEDGSFLLKVIPPSKPGSYLLDVTCLQDHVLWFEELSPHFPVTLPVTVILL